ncbi:MAG: type II toxin-antitoxin system VapC family toxin [Desulfobacterales bacterium]|nr:type II toxin-antitoxin system VapC family toxin [Desulfobacterales bacterium]
MIGLDTNVLVRYLTQDHAEQSAQANHLIESCCTRESPAMIATVVLCELVWVLRGAYKYEKHWVIKVLEQILSTKEFSIQDPHTAGSALAAYRRGPADFSDYVIIYKNRSAGCEATYTFDHKLARHKWARIPGLTEK